MLTLKQILDMKLQMDTSGVTIDNEDVLDPEFMKWVHNEPLLEVDWSRRVMYRHAPSV